MKLSKKILTLTALGLAFAAVPAFAAFDSSDWKFIKEVLVDRSASTNSTFAYVYLDHAISANSKSNWSDIRLKNSKGDEVAYLVLEDTDLPRETALPTILNSSVNSDGERQFILDLGKSGIIHNSLDLRTTSTRYQRQVRVYSADSLLPIESNSWNRIEDDGYIYKFTDNAAGFVGGSDNVTYPYSTSQYLKIVIGSGAEGPVIVSAASVNILERKVKNITTDRAKATVVENTVDKRSEYTFDMESTGALTHRVDLSLNESKNFNRRVIVESSNNQIDWTYVKTDYISHINAPLFEGHRLSIDYPEQRAQYIRLLVYNGDDAPIILSRDAVFYESPRVLLFDAAGQREFTIYYGNPKAPTPQYDLARFAQYVTLDGAERGKLGVEKENGGYSPEALNITETHPYLLTMILIILVLIVLVFAAVYLYKGGFMKNEGFKAKDPGDLSS